MKEFWVVCKKRKYDLLFFVYITTFIAFLGFIDKEIELGQYVRNVTYSLGIAFLLFIISLFFAKKGRAIFLSIIFIYTIIPSAIILSYLIVGNFFLVRNNFFAIYETSIRESMEFINSYVNWKIILTLILFFCFPILYIVKTKNEINKITRIRIAKVKINYIYILIFCVVFIFPLYFMNHQYRSESIPFTSFYVNYYKHKMFILELEKYDAYYTPQSFHVKTNMPNDTCKTFVIVIGESLSRKHMSIYGYPRNTTPLLSIKKDELLVFNDVISPHVNTIDCLKVMLTFATNHNDEAYYTKPSIIELFNYADYETYWIDNQGIIGSFESLYGILVTKAKHLIDITQKKNKIYDEVVLYELTNILENNRNQNKVIFVHLMGNHFEYKKRYPLSFEKIDNSYPFGATKINLTETHKKIINEYDNSILYNDFVVSSIIDSTKKYAPFSYVLYFSDHAEDLFDVRDNFGHSYRYSKYECDIPFILWRSNEYKKQVKISEENINTPYTNEDLIYSISQLSGLSYEEYDATKSIFSDQFKEKERTVGNKLYNDLKE